MNYTKLKEIEKNTYKELIEIDKKQGKSKEQMEKYKKYLFLKNLKEEIYNEREKNENFKFNYKR